MYRKITTFLEQWKESEHRKPLILQGARQVGKTYSVLEFGRTHYDNVVYFNFETNPKLNETFDENISPDYLIPILSHIAGQTIVKERTLIVFDEVQLCERALTSLKYFCEDEPDYHIIVAGSLLGVAVNRARFSFPVGKVDMKTMYPMDVEEFMLALGEDDLVDGTAALFQAQAHIAMDQAVHIIKVLHAEGLIEAVFFGQGLLGCFADGLFRHERAAGDQVHDEKGKGRDDEHAENAHCHALDDVLRHGFVPLRFLMEYKLGSISVYSFNALYRAYTLVRNRRTDRRIKKPMAAAIANAIVRNPKSTLYYKMLQSICQFDVRFQTTAKS